MAKSLPTTLPTDNTPKTYTGTKVKAFLLDPSATSLITSSLTLAAGVAEAATTASISSVPNVTLPVGTVLDFGGTRLTVGAEANVTNVASNVTIEAAPAAVTTGTTADYANYVQVPVTEEIAPTLADNEETIQLQGRATPVRVMNGKDLTANLKTIAGIDDPVVKRLVQKGAQLSPDNTERILFQFDDGFALLALCNIGAPKPEGRAGTAQRYNFNANSTGRLFWTDMNEASPTWHEIGALT
ncbi:hypothetical protein U9R89_21940 [Pectobacterium brasiliense]